MRGVQVVAGRARTNAIADALDSRVASYFEPEDGDPQYTRLDYVCCWLAEGKTVKSLAQELTDSLHFEVWAETLLRQLRRDYGEGAVDSALDAARARASHSLAEEALDLVDKADRDSSSAVSKAQAQARSRQWMAERYNPGRFGSNKGVSVSISVSDLLLDALRARPKIVTGSPLASIAHADAREIAPANVLPVLQIAQSSSHTSD
jgi:hypothetical protein